MLFLATAGSATGTYLAAIALSWDIFDRTDSGKWVAVLLVADFLPMVIIGLTLGPLVDRLSRRRLMIVSDLTRAATFAALPFVDRPAAIVVLAAVGGVATGFFRPAVWAGMPNLVEKDDLERATSLLATTENAAWMIGPVVAGGLLAISGPSLAYSVNAVSFVLSAALIARIPAKSLQSSDPLTRGHWRDVRGRNRPGTALASADDGADRLEHGRASQAPGSMSRRSCWPKDALDAGEIGFGVLVGSTGVGLVLGSLWAASALGRFGMTRLYGGSLLVMAAGFGLAGAAPNIAVACVLAGIAAIGNGAAIVCNQILVQRGAPDAMRGRSLAVLMSVYYACLGIGMAAAGILTDVVGPRVVWGIAGARVSRRRDSRVRLHAPHSARPRDAARGRGLRRQPHRRRSPREALGEIEATRREEEERPQKVLPYIARRRARTGSS